MLRSAFHPPLRRAVALLWLAGCLIAGATVPLAALNVGLAASLPFAAVVAALAVLAWATHRGTRWALLVDVVLLGLQILGVAGSAGSS